MSRSHLLALALTPFAGVSAAAPPPARVGMPSAPRPAPAPPPAARPAPAPPRPVAPPVAARPAPAPYGYQSGYGYSGYRGGYPAYAPGYGNTYRPGVSVGVTFGTPYRYNYPLVLGGYGAGGYYDPGYNGGYAANPVVIPSAPAAPVVPAAPAPVVIPATSETALRVTDVVPGPAAEAGLRVGDVIYAVNGARVQTGEDLRKAVAAAAEVTVEFLKPQDGRTATVTILPRNGVVGVTVESIPVEFRK